MGPDMGGGTSRSRSGAITGINVTPLVDVTLVLLIVFMVTAKLITGHKSISVDLPKARTGADAQEVFSVVLIMPTGLQVNGDILSDDDALLARATVAAKSAPEIRAVVKADGAVPHSRVMHALDQMRLAGISKVAFGVVPPPPAEKPR
jgi:biopolymer transport protein TolR